MDGAVPCAVVGTKKRPAGADLAGRCSPGFGSVLFVHLPAAYGHGREQRRSLDQSFPPGTILRTSNFVPKGMRSSAMPFSPWRNQ